MKQPNKKQEVNEEETLAIMADKELVESIKRGEEDFNKGRYEDWGKIKKELKIKV